MLLKFINHFGYFSLKIVYTIHEQKKYYNLDKTHWMSSFNGVNIQRAVVSLILF